MTQDPDVVRTRVSEIIDYRRVHEIIRQDLQDLRSFTAAIVAILPPAGEPEGAK